MRKAHFFFSLLLLAMMSILLSNCKKENVTPEPDPEKEPEEVKLVLTVNDQTFNIDENSEANTVAGNVGFSFNGDGADLSFSFKDAGSEFPFSIDGVTGSISLKSDFVLDHEVTSGYEVKVEVKHKTDSSLNKIITATIELNDLDERPDAKPKAYFPLDGNVNDMSGNNLTGIMVGEAVSVADRFGNEGKAYDLTDVTISLGSDGTYFNSSGDFTVSTWLFVKEELNGSSSIENIITKYGSGRDFVVGYDQKGRINFHLYNGGYIHCYSEENSFESEEWIHLITTYSNGKLKIFANGLKVGERDTNGKAPVWTANLLEIGYAAAYLDEVRFYDDSFTDEEIMEWYIEESVDD